MIRNNMVGKTMGDISSRNQKDIRTLPRNIQTRIRREAVQRVLEGESPDQVSRAVGVHRSRIYAWLKIYNQQGEAGLNSKLASGRPALLDQETQQSLLELIDEKSPQQMKLKGLLWTQKRFTALVQRHYGLALSKITVKRFLTGLGLNLQRLHERLNNSSHQTTRKWLQWEYPLIRQQANQQKGIIEYLSLDFLTTGGSALAAASPRGTLHFMFYTTQITADTVVKFLHFLLNETGRKLFLVIDNNHRLQAIARHRNVAGFLEGRVNDISLVYLPSAVRLPVVERSPPSSSPGATTLALPAERNLAKWALLINRSLLDTEYPISKFLSQLGKSLDGYPWIFSNLHIPSPPLRRSPEEIPLDMESVIRINKDMIDRWNSNPFLSVLKQPGDYYELNEIIPLDRWQDYEFCRHLLLDDIKHMIGFSFAGPNGTLCGLFAFKLSSDKAFGKEVRESFQLLRPYLETAVELVINNWRNAFTLTALEEATDHLEIASLVLDGSGMVIKASGAAQNMLAKKDYLKLENQHLSLPGANDQKKLERAIDKAIAWRRAPIGAKPVEVLGFNDSRENWVSVMVQPITPPSLTTPHAITVSPHVIVYITQSDKPGSNPHYQLVRQLFNLSQREAFLTTLLTNGHTIEQAAAIMNITVVTARTYLKHVYEKMGVTRRQDLVQRVVQSVALLA